MINGSEITIESTLGKLELIFNESMLLLEKNNTINVKLPNSVNNWFLKFLFTEDNDLKEGFSNWEIKNDRSIEIKLNKWNNATWTENSTPYYFKSSDGKFEIYVKVRSTATSTQNIRHIIISIWKKTLE